MYDKYSENYDKAEKLAKPKGKKVSDVTKLPVEELEQDFYVDKKDNKITISEEDYNKLSNADKENYRNQ